MKKLWSVVVWIFTMAAITACGHDSQPQQPKQVQYVQPAMPMQQEMQQQPQSQVGGDGKTSSSIYG